MLLVLWECDGATVKEIAGRLDMGSNGVTVLLQTLEASGHVRRVRDVDDDRRVRAFLTAEGHALRDRMTDVPGRATRHTELGAEECRELRELLGALRARLGSNPAAMAS